MRYPKLRELKEAVKALVKGPYTTKYPFVPHRPFERFRGRPYFHADDCVGCAACAQVCPTGAIEFHDQVKNKKGTRKLTVRWDICIFCGQCQANCLTSKGIILSQEFDFATTESREVMANEVEKEFVLCDCCFEPIAPIAQYLWVAERLGPLVFSNASLIIFYLRILDLALKDSTPRKEDLDFLRADRIKILCPRCRREAVIKS